MYQCLIIFSNHLHRSKYYRVEPDKLENLRNIYKDRGLLNPVSIKMSRKRDVGSIVSPYVILAEIETDKKNTKPLLHISSPDVLTENYSLCGSYMNTPEQGGNVTEGNLNINIPDVGSGGKDAMVLFVVIGVIVVAAVVIYMGIYVYDIVKNKRQYRYWCEIGARSTILLPNNSKYGYFQGVHFAIGFINRNVHVGITGEAGYMDLRESENDKSYTGVYGLIGPAIRFNMENTYNPSYFLLELLAGTSQRKDIGIISTAKLGVNIGIMKHSRMGLSFGSMYSNIKESEGLVHNKDEFNYFYGIEGGFRF